MNKVKQFIQGVVLAVIVIIVLMAYMPAVTAAVQ